MNMETVRKYIKCSFDNYYIFYFPRLKNEKVLVVKVDAHKNIYGTKLLEDFACEKAVEELKVLNNEKV